MNWRLRGLAPVPAANIDHALTDGLVMLGARAVVWILIESGYFHHPADCSRTRSLTSTDALIVPKGNLSDDGEFMSNPRVALG